MVPHRSTNRARRCLTSLSRREAVLSSWYGRSRWGVGYACMQLLCSQQKFAFVTRICIYKTTTSHAKYSNIQDAILKSTRSISLQNIYIIYFLIKNSSRDNGETNIQRLFQQQPAVIPSAHHAFTFKPSVSKWNVHWIEVESSPISVDRFFLILFYVVNQQPTSDGGMTTTYVINNQPAMVDNSIHQLTKFQATATHVEQACR